jgi:hypothetical protein
MVRVLFFNLMRMIFTGADVEGTERFQIIT